MKLKKGYSAPKKSIGSVKKKKTLSGTHGTILPKRKKIEQLNKLDKKNLLLIHKAFVVLKKTDLNTTLKKEENTNKAWLLLNELITANGYASTINNKLVKTS